MEQECQQIDANAFKLAWYMRGSASVREVLDMSPAQREIISKLIDENLETTKKTGLPFF